MIKTLVNKFESMEAKIKRIMHYGLVFSFLVCVLSLGLLVTYISNGSLDLYYIGLSVFRLSLFFAIEFIICAIAMDTIKQQIG